VSPPPGTEPIPQRSRNLPFSYQTTPSCWFFLDHKASTVFIIVDDVQFDCILGNYLSHQQGMIIDFVSMTISADKLNEPIKINPLTDMTNKKSLFENLPLDYSI
jgi:hypothetical protein